MAFLISLGEPSSQRTGSVSVAAARRLAVDQEGRLRPARTLDSPDKLIPALFAICFVWGFVVMVYTFHNENIMSSKFFTLKKNYMFKCFQNENLFYNEAV